MVETANLLFPDQGDDAVLRESVALFLELRAFAPGQAEEFFPAFADPDAVERRLREMLSLAPPVPDERRGVSPPALPERLQADAAPPPDSKNRRADAAPLPAGGVRNDARRAAVARKAGDEAAAEAHLASLARRVAAALHADHADGLAADLRPVLAAADGWSVEFRVLYDLQKIATDAERKTYELGPFTALASLGRTPVKRELVWPQRFDALRHLRKALRHLERSTALDPDADARLQARLTGLLHHAEARVRDDVRPVVRGVFDEVGLVPANVVEAISRDKAVEELLDAASERGFLRIGDLRDLIARNQVKMPDLAGPVEFVRGDPLLRANALLAGRLDGVYHKGEVYMRTFQRLSSLLFGTPPGRIFTKYVAVPFGGAFLLLEALHHMFEAAAGLGRWLSGRSRELDQPALVAGGLARPVAEDPDLGRSVLTTLPAFASVGVFFLLLLHWPGFRRATGRAARILLLDAPAAAWRSPLRGPVRQPGHALLRQIPVRADLGRAAGRAGRPPVRGRRPDDRLGRRGHGRALRHPVPHPRRPEPRRALRRHPRQVLAGRVGQLPARPARGHPRRVPVARRADRAPASTPWTNSSASARGTARPGWPSSCSSAPSGAC